MAIRLPILPARQLFYTKITVFTTSPGETINGHWVDGAITSQEIMGSFQPPSPLREDINIDGSAGLGERMLWTIVLLPFYDINSSVQCWVEREGLRWRITSRHVWDPYVSRTLYVYGLERYHNTIEQTPEP